MRAGIYGSYQVIWTVYTPNLMVGNQADSLCSYKTRIFNATVLNGGTVTSFLRETRKVRCLSLPSPVLCKIYKGLCYGQSLERTSVQFASQELRVIHVLRIHENCFQSNIHDFHKSPVTQRALAQFNSLEDSQLLMVTMELVAIYLECFLDRLGGAHSTQRQDWSNMRPFALIFSIN